MCHECVAQRQPAPPPTPTLCPCHRPCLIHSTSPYATSGPNTRFQRGSQPQGSLCSGLACLTFTAAHLSHTQINILTSGEGQRPHTCRGRGEGRFLLSWGLGSGQRSPATRSSETGTLPPRRLPSPEKKTFTTPLLPKLQGGERESGGGSVWCHSDNFQLALLQFL